MALTRKNRGRGRRSVTSLRRTSTLKNRRTNFGNSRRNKHRRHEGRPLTTREFKESMKEVYRLLTPEPVQKMKSLERQIEQSTMTPTPGKSSKVLRDRLQRERTAFAATNGSGPLNTNFSTPLMGLGGAFGPSPNMAGIPRVEEVEEGV